MFLSEHLVSGDHPIHQDVLDAVEKFGKDNGRAVRILFGTFSEYSPGPWTQEQADANEISLTNAQENGITLVNWGSASPQTGVGLDRLPSSAYTDGTSREMEIKEVMVVAEGATRQGIAHTIVSDDGANLQIGEYAERTYWLFFHLAFVPDADKLNLDAFIFDPWRASMDKDFVEKFREEQALASAKAFAEMMIESPKNRMQTLQGEIDANISDLSSSQQRAIDISVRLNMQKREMDTILESFVAPAEHWIEEWKVIENHPCILPGTLQMNADRQLTFDTTLLRIADPSQGSDVSYPLGNMRVTVSMGTNTVRIKNLNNRRRERDHPHVPNEVPCWGNWNAEVIDHIVNMRIAGLVEFILMYLQSYNPEDADGRTIALWRENSETLVNA